MRSTAINFGTRWGVEGQPHSINHGERMAADTCEAEAWSLEPGPGFYGQAAS